LLLAGAALPASVSALGQCVTDTPAVDACLGGVRVTGPPGKTLDLNFMAPGNMPGGITFTRASTATYTDASGTIQTAAINAPRWDYDPVTHALRGVLIEEPRTNLALWNRDFTNAAWGLYGNVAAAPVVTANQATAPDGTLTATRVVLPAVSGAGSASVIYQPFTATAAIYTYSIWLRGAVGGEQVYLGGGGVSFISAPRLTLTTQWQRFIFITPTLTAASWTMSFCVDLRDPAQTGTPVQTIYAWGAQVELGAFATSSIPTAASAVTRAQDIMTMPLAAWYSGTAGTLMVDAMLPANGNNGFRGIFSLDGGITNTWIRAYTFNASANVNGNVNAANLTFGVMTPDVPFKIAATYAAGGTTVAFNGVMGTGTASVSTPASYTTLRLGVADAGPANPANGYLRAARYWPRVLSTSEMQSVTA
jgi:hypothetical protein